MATHLPTDRLGSNARWISGTGKLTACGRPVLHVELSDEPTCKTCQAVATRTQKAAAASELAKAMERVCTPTEAKARVDWARRERAAMMTPKAKGEHK